MAALIGRMGDEDSYLRALYQPVALVLLGVLTGMGVTLQTLAARAVGRGEPALVQRYFTGILRACALASVALLVLVLLIRSPLADWLRVTGDVRSFFDDLLLAMTLTFPFSLAGEACSAVLRGTGYAGTGTLVSLGQVLVNVAVVAVLGLHTGLGLYAVAFGAVIAGSVEFGVGVALLRRRGLLVRGRRLGISVPVLPSLARVGLPTASASLLLSVVTFLLMGIAAPWGPVAVTSLSLGSLVELLALTPAIGYGSAMSTLMHQCLGADDWPGALRVFRRGLLHVGAGYVALTLVMVMTGPRLSVLLSDDPAVVEGIGRYLAIVGPAFGATGVVLSASAVLAPLGRGLLALLLNALYFTAVLGIGSWAADRYGGVEGLYWTMALAALASVVTGLPIICWAVVRAVRPVGPSKETAIPRPPGIRSHE
ncbi:MATE family efflux transporter [Streptomyces sp. NBC_01092]|uniref:MATE family efflux transporter n=1 Tax=Streptomyces sp. NBC_01092 TaxID=2903748 RepID=UPI0038700A55|nr:MATE family efflux transporter [Streptomyces sp. NBC_01092]